MPLHNLWVVDFEISRLQTRDIVAAFHAWFRKGLGVVALHVHLSMAERYLAMPAALEVARPSTTATEFAVRGMQVLTPHTTKLASALHIMQID